MSEKNIQELRHNLAHLSIQAVRDFYEQAYRDCRLIYHQLPSPKTDANAHPGMEAIVEAAVIREYNFNRSGRRIQMYFKKTFFTNFQETLLAYEKRSKAQSTTVIIKILGREYKVATIISYDDDVLTFLFYEEPPGQEGLPMLSVPYSRIEWIQVSAASKKDSKLGFKPTTS